MYYFILSLFLSNFITYKQIPKEQQRVIWNDTICLKNVKPFENRYFKLVKFCEVIFNDSVSDKLNRKIGTGELRRVENFDKANSELKFNKHNNIVYFDLLSMGSRKNHIVPDVIILRNDTLFVREKFFGSVDYQFSTIFHKTEYVIEFSSQIHNLKIIKLQADSKSYK